MTDSATTVEETVPAEELDLSAFSIAERTAADEALLRVEGVSKAFGGLQAVDDVSFEISEGSITGLIGPNGAGKSTTFNLVSGLYELDEGRVIFDGTDVTGLQPYQVAQHGLVRTFQIARELGDMTVAENLMLSPPDQDGEQLWRAVLPYYRQQVREQEQELYERIQKVMAFFEIDHLAGQYSRNLSGGQRKLLEFARALVTDPAMLMLDEPFAGVNPTLEQKLLTNIHQLADLGFTFLMVEHDMDVIMHHCEHVIVMHQGSILMEGPPEEVRQDERVMDAYLGRET